MPPKPTDVVSDIDTKDYRQPSASCFRLRRSTAFVRDVHSAACRQSMVVHYSNIANRLRISLALIGVASQYRGLCITSRRDHRDQPEHAQHKLPLAFSEIWTRRIPLK